MTQATTRHPITLAVIILVLAATPGPPLLDAQDRIPHSWQIVAPEQQPVLGYTTATALPARLVDDVGLVVDAVLGPDDELFDMSNSPALFHYLLGTRPATRYYHISMAIRRSTQRDLIDQLRRTRPMVVILDAGFGLPNWDLIPNTVRHYDVSEYVLRRYRPLVHVRSFTFMLRADLEPPDLDELAAQLSEPPGTENPLADSRPCEWGYAPEFLADDGPTARSAGRALPFTVTPHGRGQEVAVELPPDLSPVQFGRLEIETRRALRADKFTLSQPPAASKFPISFKTTGEGTQRYRIRVGSCPQWYAYTPGRLLIESGRPQDIVAIRLYR